MQRDKHRSQPERYRNVPLRVSRDDDISIDQQEEEEEEEEEEERPPRRRKRRKRSVWPILLIGCGLGVFCSVLAAVLIVFLAIRFTPGGNVGGGGIPMLGGTHTFTREETQQVSLSTLAQMQVCDKIGNVTITVDPNASSTIVATRKIVHATSQSEADQQFKRISVEVQPPGTITTPLVCPQANALSAPSPSNGAAAGSIAKDMGNSLTVNITVPDSNSFLPNSSNGVDVTITVPASVLPQSGPTMRVNVAASLGNIDVDGLSGILNIQGSTGNVSVKHAILVDGSHIDTAQGNVAFDGRLVIPNLQDTQHTGNFKISSEKGDLDVTLPSTTNVLLDANTNVGMIKSDFGIHVENNQGAASYHGPLNASAGISTTTLVLDVSTGNVTIHQASL